MLERLLSVMIDKAIAVLNGTSDYTKHIQFLSLRRLILVISKVQKTIHGI